MFRLWIRLFTDNRLTHDMTVEDDSFDTRTHKVRRAIEEGCDAFDVGKPIWLKKNVSDFQRYAACRFTKDNFVEEISFDYMDVRVIEEDDSICPE